MKVTLHGTLLGLIPAAACNHHAASEYITGQLHHQGLQTSAFSA